MAKKYDMLREHWTDYYAIRVSKTIATMRRDIKTYAAEDGEWAEEDESSTVAMCHPYTSNPSGPFAVLFFNEERLDEGIVSHEVLHLAFAHERWILRFDGDYGAQCGPHEERLCYYHSEQLMAILLVLRENGHIE